MFRAAELWADARGRGEGTAAEPALDGDVILASQAQETGGVVMTTNVKHLVRFVKAFSWKELVKPPAAS